MSAISVKKNTVREDFLQQRMKMPFEEVFRASSIIQKKFLKLGEFTKAGRIALYSSLKNEVLTDEIFEHMQMHGKEAFFPRVDKARKEISFIRVDGKEELSTGAYEIREPAHKPGCGIFAPLLDIVVVPGIAFDKRGNRLGYGKGYYDRALGNLPKSCLIVALAFGFQIVDELPSDVHDVKMDRIITEDIIIENERGE